VNYSKGHFGFSVQKQIYVECGATLDGEYPGDEIWRKFGDRVGWRKDGRWLFYSDLNPSLPSPQGIFPVGGWIGSVQLLGFQTANGIAVGRLTVGGLAPVSRFLFSRIETCQGEGGVHRRRCGIGDGGDGEVVSLLSHRDL